MWSWGSPWQFLEKMFLGKKDSISVNSFIWNAPPKCLKFEKKFFSNFHFYFVHGSQPPTCAGHVPWQLGLLPYPQSRSVGADWQKTHSETLVLYFSQPDQSGKETEFCPWPVEIEIHVLVRKLVKLNNSHRKCLDIRDWWDESYLRNSG